MAVPVIVIGYVPAAVADVVVNVTVEDVPAVTDAGLNDTDTPDGAPLEVNATDCAEPDVTAVLTVAVADEPAATVAEVGETATEKPFVGVPPVTVYVAANGRLVEESPTWIEYAP